MFAEAKPHPRFHEIYWITMEDGSSRLATKNLIPGNRVYGERLIRDGNDEYRFFDPFRSKLAAAVIKGLERLPVKPAHKILYLGAASGTTASHISDMVGKKGHVYCIEFAPRAAREMVDKACVFRLNMSPILADARFPDRYLTLVEKVDGVYCDVAQPQQAVILSDNADLFLRSRGWIMLAIKAQSIDVTKEPSEIYDQEIAVLRRRGFKVEENVNLEPYSLAHTMISAQYSSKERS